MATRTETELVSRDGRYVHHYYVVKQVVGDHPLLGSYSVSDPHDSTLRSMTYWQTQHGRMGAAEAALSLSEKVEGGWALKRFGVVAACAAVALTVGCAPARPEHILPPSETGVVAILERGQYEPAGGVVAPAIAYVDAEGNVVVGNPWYSSSGVKVGEAAPWSAPKWGYDPSYDEGGNAVPLHKLAFVAPNSAVLQCDVSTGQTRELPLDLGGATQVQPSYSTSGEFVVVDLFAEQPPRLLIFQQDGTKMWEVTYGTIWTWSPSSEWLAIDVSRRAGLGHTSDLALFSWASNSTTVLARGDRSHAWCPVGWASSDLLAYENAFEEGDPLRWINAADGTTPGGTPSLGLQWDKDRMARLIPENLRATWNGQYAVDGSEKFAAIACQEPDGSPMVYVTSLEDGRWFRLAAGDRPAWVQYPRRSWSD